MARIRSTNQELQAERPLHEEADALLTNWGRWARPNMSTRRGWHPAFRHVRVDRWPDGTDPGAPVPYCAPPDAVLALAVERVLTHPTFWPQARTLLVGHYAMRFAPLTVCRALGLRHSAYPDELHRAVHAFWNRWSKTADSTLLSRDSHA